MKVCFETFGCRLNKAEALQMEAEYLAKGWERTEKHSDADLFVVRGCSVTTRAQHECEELIGHLKRHYPIVPIRICGCLEVKNQPNLSAFAAKATALQAQPATPATPTRTARAYLKVQDGCAGKCTFCIVPKFRGESKSVDFTEVMDAAKRFIDVGYHEIVVTGCNLSLYASQGRRLPELLSSLASLTGQDDARCRIRLGSLEPGACAMETVHAIAESPNVCRFLHLPIQSGSSRILMSMQRPYVMKDVDDLIQLVQDRIPVLGLGCDIMTGFPSESELDYAATRGLMKRLPFNRVHVFPYSERPGTPAVAYARPVDKAVRRARAHALADIVESRRHKFARSFIGKTVEIVVEKEDKCIGWTGEYLKCEATGSAPRKSIARIFVMKAKDDHLFGRLLPTGSHDIASNSAG